MLDPFRLNLLGKYLTYAFVALGLVICWGYGGILSLGQGVFFGLGGYCMAMYLKLEASSVANTKIQSTPGIPDFMDWNQITALPTFWVPFKSFPLTILAVLVVPTLLAFIISWGDVQAARRRRLFRDHHASGRLDPDHPHHRSAGLHRRASTASPTCAPCTAGTSAPTTLTPSSIMSMRCCLLLCLLVGQYITRSKLGRILVAMRSKVDRVRFSGYSVAGFQVFAFCIAATFAAIGGAMFTLQVGFMSPSFVGIVPSIEMVIYTAVGGRLSLFGAIYGTLLVNYAKSSFSEAFPQVWQLGLGALFIVVVLVFPQPASPASTAPPSSRACASCSAPAR